MTSIGASYPPTSRDATERATASAGGSAPTTTRSGPSAAGCAACVACPFQSRKRWVETKRRWPELFAEAVEIDDRLRGGLAYVKEPYLHSLRIPLAEAVALGEAELGEDGQRDGFGNECEGHCGV